jgi:glucose/mannose-6-phosphate isomerase
MLELIKNFHNQWIDAKKISEKISLKKIKNINSIVIAGMGGSAIGGDIFKACYEDELKMQIIVNREYLLPSWVNKNTLVFAISYSGNTEETLSAYEDAKQKNAKIICITSGGKLEEVASKDKIECVKIPTNYPPRSALGYLFIPIVMSVSKIGLLKNQNKNINETGVFIEKLIKEYSSSNTIKEIAEKMYKKPILICAGKFLKPAAYRFKTQINENAKAIAYTVSLPEMNHNEIVGWAEPLKKKLKYWVVALLMDKEDHDRVKLRFEITKKIFNKITNNIIEIHSKGESKLARIFSVILLGDFVSVYLANLYQIDPRPVKIIDFLKQELSVDKRK